jgi:hypothetical protein
MAEVKEASRALEFTNPKMHVGWKGAKPVFTVYSLPMAEGLFKGAGSPGVIAICVAPPYSMIAENFEQAVHFFSDDNVSAFVNSAIFAY